MIEMPSMKVKLALIDSRHQVVVMLSAHLAELGVDEPYRYLDLYWAEPDSRFPYLIMSRSEVVGFALIRQSTEVEIAEFYIKPAARQRGIGRLAVEALIQRHVGVWLVSVFPGNARALVFWKTVLNDLDLSNLTESEATGGVVFRFEA